MLDLTGHAERYVRGGGVADCLRLAVAAERDARRDTARRAMAGGEGPCVADSAFHCLDVAELSAGPRYSVDGQAHALRAALCVAEAVFGKAQRVVIPAGVVLAETLHSPCPRLEPGVLREVAQPERLEAVSAGQGEVAAADGNVTQHARRGARDAEELPALTRVTAVAEDRFRQGAVPHHKRRELVMLKGLVVCHDLPQVLVQASNELRVYARPVKLPYPGEHVDDVFTLRGCRAAAPGRHRGSGERAACAERVV